MININPIAMKIEVTQPQFYYEIANPTNVSYNYSGEKFKMIHAVTWEYACPEPKEGEILFQYSKNRGYILDLNIPPMKVYNKVVLYRNFKYNIDIQLDYSVERSLDGKRKHRVIVTSFVLGENYLYQDDVLDSLLEKAIVSFQQEAEKWIDKQIDGDQLDSRLINLGFK